MMLRRGFRTALLSVSLVTSFAAADRLYVVCDNGLCCFKAPCPSWTVD